MFATTHNTADIRRYFQNALLKREFTLDKSKCNMIELIGASFLADSPTIFGIPNQLYIDKEIAWYDAMSTNIFDMQDPPKQWVATANKEGDINSNYGYLLYHHDNHNQYTHVFSELLANANSRRACAIYNRPSMWLDYDARGKNDFVCTNAVTYYIRNNQLHAVVQMRSNDVVFGYKNDYAWQSTVLQRLVNNLNHHLEAQLKTGTIVWQAQNLHVYERHFDLIK